MATSAKGGPLPHLFQRFGRWWAAPCGREAFRTWHRDAPPSDLPGGILLRWDR